MVVDCKDVAAREWWWADVLDWHLAYESDAEAVIIPEGPGCRPRTAEEWSSVGKGIISEQFRRPGRSRTGSTSTWHPTSPMTVTHIGSQLARGAFRLDVGRDESDVSWTVLPRETNSASCRRGSADRALRAPTKPGPSEGRVTRPSRSTVRIGSCARPCSARNDALGR